MIFSRTGECVLEEVILKTDPTRELIGLQLISSLGCGIGLGEVARSEVRVQCF